MSLSFNAKNEAVLENQLKCQVLWVTANDNQIYDANSGNGKFTIGEKLKEVRLVVQKDDSASTNQHFNAADIAISGTNSDEIVVTGLALDANDCALVVYVVEEQ